MSSMSGWMIFDKELTADIRLLDKEISLSPDDETSSSGEFEEENEEKPFQQMIFYLASDQAEFIRDKISETKNEIDFDLMDCSGNDDEDGNALYCLLKGFVDVRK